MITTLAWKPPYATGTVLKGKKKNQKEDGSERWIKCKLGQATSTNKDWTMTPNLFKLFFTSFTHCVSWRQVYKSQVEKVPTFLGVISPLGIYDKIYALSKNLLCNPPT